MISSISRKVRQADRRSAVVAQDIVNPYLDHLLFRLLPPRQEGWAGDPPHEPLLIGRMEGKSHTMRYKFCAVSSVSTMMSLHKKPRSLRPLFALNNIPSLRSFRWPICRVGAVRSKRLKVPHVTNVDKCVDSLSDLTLDQPTDSAK